jgi:hypothetical protein
MTDLEALVVAAYVFADECPVAARPSRPALVSDAELVALAVCEAAIGISSDRQFLGLVGRVLPGWFPHLPDQSQYNRRLRQLVGLITTVQQRLARWLDSGGVRLADGSQLAVASYPGCQRRSQFAGFARYGYSKSHHGFLWGVRLVRACHRLSKLLLRQGRCTTRPPGRGPTMRGFVGSGSRAGRFRSCSTSATAAWSTRRPRGDALDAAIVELAASEPYVDVVERLVCLRGVSTLTAFALSVELGDWCRFRPESLGPFLGLTPPRASTQAASGAGRVRSARPVTATHGGS